MNEFDIIEHYFKTCTAKRNDITLSIGDDCALLTPNPNELLAVSTDTLVSDIHFFANTDPFHLGHKALAVNLSDLAAMGAIPAWFTLCLTLPNHDEQWLKQFTKGLTGLSNRYKMGLVGGDITRGPLSITIQVMGSVPPQLSLKRNTAKPGDHIFVSGPLGEAGAALQLLKNKLTASPKQRKALIERLEQPEPRIELGLKLRNIAHAAIDISDGLLADLNHILQQSQVGATIYLNRIPLSNTIRSVMDLKTAQHTALTAGDDYELCFTLSKKQAEKHKTQLAKWQCHLIGEITQEPRLQLIDQDGSACTLPEMNGYKHF